MSKELRICPGVGARKCGAFLARLDRDPHPTCTRCRGRVCTRDMTCDFCAVWSAEQWALFAKKRSYKERKHRPSGSAPPAQQTSPRAETSSGVSRPGTSSASSSRPLGGQGKQEGSQGAPGVVSGGAPSPPARPRSSERGGSASGHLSGVSGLASSSPSPSGGGGVEVARSRQTSHSRVSESVDSPSFSPHVPRRENVRESSGSCSRAVSSRDSRSSVREPRKDRRARSREGSSRGRRRLSRSRSSSRSRSRGRERARRSSSASRSSRGRSRRERSRSSDRYRSRRGSSRSRRDRSRSSDRYRSRRDRSRRERSRSVDRSRSRRERARSPAHRGERRDRSRSHASPSRSVDCSQSMERLPASSARLRGDGAGRLARRGTQEGVEAFASQPPVAPGGAVDVTPAAGGASMTALPSAMKELARFFLNLSGSSSLGASGDSAGVTASGAVLGDLAGPSSSASGAATFCGTAAAPAGAGVLPDASDALPSVSGEHRRRVRSRSRGRRSRSSSDRTDRRAKKRSRRGSPSPERAEPSRVATLKRHYRKSGFSGRAARVLSGVLRESSSRLYQSRWQIFCGWCRGRSVAPVNASVPVVVDFLIHLRQDKGLSVSAVKGYCSALNSVLALKGRDLAASREITTLLRSFARSVNPVELRPPAWDVSLVLQSLMGAPYEPLRTCEERFLAQKTLFLLALASAKRIGELHALSYRVSHTRDWGEVSFAFVTGFVAKTQDPSSLAPRFEGFSVPALTNARKNRNGRLLCPVRAVKVYLDRTAPHRPRCERLFVTAGRSKKEISKTTVSFWLRKTISRAYELSGTALPVPAPRARETRGIAPSILFRKNFAVDQVLKAGTWRRHTTFTRHYLRDIAHKSLDTFHLGPVVAAQSVV